MKHCSGGAPIVICGWILLFAFSLCAVSIEASPCERDFDSRLKRLCPSLRKHLLQRKRLKAKGSKSKKTAEPNWKRFPYLVFVLNRDYQKACSGVLIDNATVLTAAHCLVNIDKGVHQMQTSPLVTRIGDPLETAHNVKYAILHPFWDPEKIGSDMGSDIAVLILSEPFPAMPFPSLANFGTAVERNLSGVVGSGANEMADVHQLKLKCQQEFSEDGNITSGDLVCFTRQTGSKDRPCQGDSGAPLIKPSSLMIPDHDLLLGILSSGHVCGGFEKSGDVFTEISKYTLWIRHVQKHPEKCSYSETPLPASLCLPEQHQNTSGEPPKCRIKMDSTISKCGNYTFWQLANDYGWTELHAAACTNRFIECVDNFSVEDFSVEISGPFGPGIPFKKKSTALHVVAAFGTTDTANAMVNLFPTGLKFSAENEAGETPLHHAAAVGNFKMVVWLLEENVDINARSYGETPLTYAARELHVKTVEVLIDRGAKVEMNEAMDRFWRAVCLRKKAPLVCQKLVRKLKGRKP